MKKYDFKNMSIPDIDKGVIEHKYLVKYEVLET